MLQKMNQQADFKYFRPFRSDTPSYGGRIAELIDPPNLNSECQPFFILRDHGDEDSWTSGRDRLRWSALHGFSITRFYAYPLCYFEMEQVR